MKIPDEVIVFLEAYSQYYIIGHIEPDGDCLASQLGLVSFLELKTKKALAFSAGPFSRPEVQHLENRFAATVPPADENTGLVFVDCSTPERIGPYSTLIGKMPSLVIDHHSSGKLFGDIQWIEPSVPAVTLMIQELFTQEDIYISDDTRRVLLLGLATDTGYFRHLDGSSGWVFEYASRLISDNVSPKETYTRMYGNRPIESRILLGRILGRLKTYFDGKLLCSYETLSDQKKLGTQARDSDLLYSILLGTRGIQALYIIREEEHGRNSVGLRSLYDIDVSSIAAEYGGGGHKNAAGFSSVLKRKKLHKKLQKSFRAVFSNNAP